MAWLYLFGGILLLLFGGDLLVRGAVDLALRLKVSVLVIGMTVVAFATSAPELLVSLDAALDGYNDISFGNVIGSNIANIALILGLTATIVPLTVQQKTYRLDWWVMTGVTILLLLFLWFDHTLVFWESAILVLLLIVYNVFMIMVSRKNRVPQDLDPTRLKKNWVMMLYLAAGVAGLKFGSELLITGAVELAEKMNISERVIAITVVSVGTSLPELAASLIAAFKREPDLSVGNLIGSNIFNVLAVLGITGMITDLPVTNLQLMTFDFPWLLGISVLLFIIMRFFGKGEITRFQGFLLFATYLIYLWAVLA